MPGGDGNGPMGKGPMTGRGAGCCSGSEVPGFMNRGLEAGDFEEDAGAAEAEGVGPSLAACRAGSARRWV
jgi:hypothetical protein